MRHVDHAHDTEGDGKPDGGQHQYRAQREAEIKCREPAVELQLLLDTGQRHLGGLGQLRIITRRGAIDGGDRGGVQAAGQCVQRCGVAIGFQLLDGEPLLESGADSVIAFLLDQARQPLGHGFIDTAAQAARRRESDLGIRRRQIDHRQHAIDMPTQRVVAAQRL